MQKALIMIIAARVSVFFKTREFLHNTILTFDVVGL